MKQSERIVKEYAENIVKYYSDPDYREEMERRASLETAGNVTWIEATLCAMSTAIDRYLHN